MARPRAKELTERELEIMHIFWDKGEITAQQVRDELTRSSGRDLAYTTIATLVRILLDKGFLAQTYFQRPYRFKPGRSFEEVSKNLVSDMVERVFCGSREQLLLGLVGKKLTAKERAAVKKLLQEDKS